VTEDSDPSPVEYLEAAAQLDLVLLKGMGWCEGGEVFVRLVMFDRSLTFCAHWK
jgi:hypothetical protein